MDFSTINRVHMLGIGGIGMSALAFYFDSRKIKVSGYDKTETNLTRKLVNMGIEIQYKENPDRVTNEVDLLVFTPAVPSEHSELIKAESLGIQCMKRSKALGVLSEYHDTIAVSGTHGKTTTSAILSHILIQSSQKPICFVGGIMNNYDSNYFDQGGDIMVAEADEFDRSFLQLNYKHAIITSVDADHLDVYGNHNEMKKTFLEFANIGPENGLILINEDVELDVSGINIRRYGFKSAIRISHIKIHGKEVDFNYEDEEVCFIGLRWSMLGRHNLSNACAAIRMSREIGVGEQEIRSALKSFSGILRRFNVYYGKSSILIDDYAHHPKELEAVIHTARERFPGKHLTGIFQPHLYSRTKDFASEFCEVLSTMDRVILCEIYPARELPIPGVNSQMLLEGITTEKWFMRKEMVAGLIEEMETNVIMVLGAGDIDIIVKELIKNI